jgi:hydroxyacylglutathione hydrolase
MLEDDFTWVIRKAFKGLALAPGEAALRARLRESDVMAFSRGNFSEKVARQLAPVLGLDPDALANHGRYLPNPVRLKGVHRLDLPFGDERVNAWLIESGSTRILFDTGDERESCAAAIGGRTIDQIFITHGHGDHIGGIPDFMKMGIPIAGPEIYHASAVKPGDSFRLGNLVITACDLSGHFNPSVGYRIDGLEAPALVTGDALFAGSMGGCGTPELYQHALNRLRDVLCPLPDSTVLLPGHGPATTLGEERLSNPFI